MENPASSAPRSSAPVAKKRPSLKRSSGPEGGLLLARYGTRHGRRESASDFRRKHDMSSVLRYHIQAGAPLCSRRATSFGLPWVSVHGIDSICAVTRSNDMHCLRQDMMPHVELNPQFFFVRFWNIGFWNAIISEVEDIVAPPCDPRRRFNKSSKKSFSVGPSGESCQILSKCSKRPFGVVSMIEDINEASSDVYDVENAIKFIQEELESGAVFTFDKTTQTAVSAFQHLFCREFEADEIQVFVLKNDESLGRELKQIREDPDIEECLAIINGAGAGLGVRSDV